MKIDALYIVLLILLGLIFCSCLANMYRYKEGFTDSNSDSLISSLQNGDVYTDASGNKITVVIDSSGTTSLQLIQVGSNTPIVLTTTPSPNYLGTTQPNSFYAQVGKMSATVATGSDGNIIIIFKLPNGQTDIFTNLNSSSNSSTINSSLSSSSSSSSYDNYNHYTGTSATLQNGEVFTDAMGNTITVITTSSGTQSLQLVLIGNSTPIILSPKSSNTTVNLNMFYSQDGNMSAIIFTDSNGDVIIKVNFPNGKSIIFTNLNSTYSNNSNNTNNTNNLNNMTSTQYYGSTGSSIQPNNYAVINTNPSSLSNSSLTNSSYYNSNANTSSYDYSSSLSKGIPLKQIPYGDEDLYILKSEVVPPVCPACPASSACPRTEKCPPCPACARCPEPSFECKKVPNYNAINNTYLPTPVLNSFAAFGM
jgi:hypothetical protein